MTQTFTIQERVQVWKLQVFLVGGQDHLVIIHGGELQGGCANYAGPLSVQPGSQPQRRLANAVYGSTPDRTAINSAAILTAISSGVSAPIDRPMGQCTRAISASVNPSFNRSL